MKRKRRRNRSVIGSTTLEAVPSENAVVIATSANVEKNTPEQTVQQCERSEAGRPQKTRKQIQKSQKHPTKSTKEYSSLPSPVCAERFAFWLLGCNADEMRWIYEGFKYGFRIGYKGSRKFRDCKNQKSAQEMPEILLKYVVEEVALGRMAGPFDEPPFPDLICSPAGLRRKSDGYSPEGQAKKPDGRYRTIQNLSSPYDGESVNAGIPKADKTVRYPGVQDVIDFIVQLGKGAQLIKTDIKKAYVTISM